MRVIDLDEFVIRDYERVVRAVALATGDADGACDAVQEALARAMEQDRRGHTIEHPAGWVATVALNVSRRRFRRLSHETTLLARLAPSATAVDSEHDAGLDLHRALVRLPLRQRQSIVLHHLLDLDVATTARTLGVSEATVKTALVRGRAALAGALQPSTDSVEIPPRREAV